MKSIISLLFCMPLLIFAQYNAPEVNNVTFSQRTDGSFIVDVYYDLNDADGDKMFVAMHVSADSGVTWNFPCDSLIGDVGADILTGTGKHIVWDFGREHPQTSGTDFIIQIVSDDAGFESGTVTDIDGNVYQTVQIGNQWWMAENLKVTHYRNGDVIPNVTEDTTWVRLSAGAYCSYDNADSNIATYGLLYNWFAVDDSRNIAPAGWHVPTDGEWKELEMYLGMIQREADDTGYRGTNEGSKLKATSGWYSGGNGTNESGFSALPGGYCGNDDGTFYGMGSFGSWWSSTEVSSAYAWHRILNYDHSGVGRSGNYKQSGFSLRCVRD